jgi:signal transduction histidine kinase
MMFNLAALPRSAQAVRRYGAIAILAAIVVAGVAALAAVSVSDRRNDEVHAAHAAMAAATDTARALLDRQQHGLDALARIGATASDATAQQFLDRASALAPGIRGAALADPAGTVELRSAEGLDETAFAALAGDAARQAAANPDAPVLTTRTLQNDNDAIVGLARPWRDAAGRLGGVALVAVDATAFPGLGLARGDGTPLFAVGAAPDAKRVPLSPYPLTLAYPPSQKGAGAWPFIAAAVIGTMALFGLVALLLRQIALARREIARRALVERELRDKLADAADAAGRIDELSRTKSRFFAQVTHELRTPLNAIIGFSETIRQEIFGPLGNIRYLEYVGLINDAGSHLLSLINDLLDEARIESGKMEIAPIRVAAPALARSALDLVEMLAGSRDIALATTGLSSCPDLNVDPRSMKQVLVNLLSNAIKYTPPGGHIDVRFAVDGDHGATIEVADTGIGMSPEDLQVAFEPFGRAGDLKTRRQQGTGLGLSLARSLVRLHGGDLTLASKLDRGTTATVTLPPSAVFAADAKVPAKAA